MNISFSTLACPGWSWLELLKHAAAFGYGGIEIRMLQGDVDLLRAPEFQNPALPKSKRELADAGLQICGLASSVRFDSPDANQRRAQLHEGRAYLCLAQELGARFVRVFGDTLPPEPATRRLTFGQIAEGLRTLGDDAEQCGVDLLLETHGDFADSRLAESLMRAVDHPQVGILWDTHHPWRFFGESLAETWTRLKPWVRHTHWKDSVKPRMLPHTAATAAAEEQARALMSGHRPADYVLFGEGEFPIGECLRLLEEAGYDGWYSLEWEKAWHPEIADPEIALPPFPRQLRAWSGHAAQA